MWTISDRRPIYDHDGDRWYEVETGHWVLVVGRWGDGWERAVESHATDDDAWMSWERADRIYGPLTPRQEITEVVVTTDHQAYRVLRDRIPAVLDMLLQRGEIPVDVALVHDTGDH